MAKRLVGTLEAAGDGGTVFEEDGRFFVVGTSMVIGEDDVERTVRSRGPAFASLEALLAAQPQGVRFLPEPD